MNDHYSDAEWNKYIQGEMTSRDEQRMEEHLLECDECLFQYTALAEHIPIPSPPQLNEELLIERVMGKAEQAKAAVPAVKKRHGKRTNLVPLIHYAIAASLTIIFVGSGGFELLVSHASNITEVVEVGNHQSIDANKWNEWKAWISEIVSPKGEVK